MPFPRSLAVARASVRLLLGDPAATIVMTAVPLVFIPFLIPGARAQAVSAGPLPRYAASSDPPRSASTAGGPALNLWKVMGVGASARAKVPSASPTSAWAWVRLGKKPTRSGRGVLARVQPIARSSTRLLESNRSKRGIVRR